MHLISLKLENRVRRFHIFLMATHLFPFIHDILYIHILYMFHKKMLRVAQKTILRQQKIFYIEVTLRTKTIESQKYMLRQQKKYGVPWNTVIKRLLDIRSC